MTEDRRENRVNKSKRTKVIYITSTTRVDRYNEGMGWKGSGYIGNNK